MLKTKGDGLVGKWETYHRPDFATRRPGRWNAPPADSAGVSRDSLATGRVIESYPPSDEERYAVRKRPRGPERVREGKGNEEEVEVDQSQAEGKGILDQVQIWWSVG